MATKARSPLPLEFHPLTPARWSDFATLFGERGACAGCWCMYWRLPRSEFLRNKGAGNKGSIRRLVEQGPPGILAYQEGRAIAWCAVAPRPAYPVLERSRILRPVDDQQVWSIVCFFVARPFRRRGVTAPLLQAAARFAAEQGARVVEGYPVEPKKAMADVFVYTGLASAFRRAGFVEIARRSPTRPIMRWAPGG